MVLFERILLSSRVLNEVRHRAVHWNDRNADHMIALSWALQKGDWWKSKTEDRAKFFTVEWRKIDGIYRRTGIYIGRLALVYQTKPREMKVCLKSG